MERNSKSNLSIGGTIVATTTMNSWDHCSGTEKGFHCLRVQPWALVAQRPNSTLPVQVVQGEILTSNGHKPDTEKDTKHQTTPPWCFVQIANGFVTFSAGVATT